MRGRAKLALIGGKYIRAVEIEHPTDSGKHIVAVCVKDVVASFDGYAPQVTQIEAQFKRDGEPFLYGVDDVDFTSPPNRHFHIRAFFTPVNYFCDLAEAIFAKWGGGGRYVTWSGNFHRARHLVASSSKSLIDFDSDLYLSTRERLIEVQAPEIERSAPVERPAPLPDPIDVIQATAQIIAASLSDPANDDVRPRAMALAARTIGDLVIFESAVATRAMANRFYAISKEMENRIPERERLRVPVEAKSYSLGKSA